MTPWPIPEWGTKPRAVWPAGLPAPVLRAIQHYPNDPYLQDEYMRAVQVVRSTSRGWTIDNPARRNA